MRSEILPPRSEFSMTHSPITCFYLVKANSFLISPNFRSKRRSKKEKIEEESGSASEKSVKKKSKKKRSASSSDSSSSD